MPRLTIFKSSVPRGMRVFKHGVEVAINERLNAARNFAKRHKRRLYLSHATDHRDDPSAIRIIGKSTGWFFERSGCIGYVPAGIADKLVRTNMVDKVKVRLQMISFEDKHLIKIRFDIFGPEDDYEDDSPIF